MVGKYWPRISGRVQIAYLPQTRSQSLLIKGEERLGRNDVMVTVARHAEKEIMLLENIR